MEIEIVALIHRELSSVAITADDLIIHADMRIADLPRINWVAALNTERESSHDATPGRVERPFVIFFPLIV